MGKKNKAETEIKNSKNKLFIILGVIVVLLIIVILAVYLINNGKDNDDNKPNNENEVINNTNEGVIGDKVVDGLSLTSTSLKYENGMSTLETLVTNNSDSAYYLEEFHIIVKDENGNDLINYEDEDGNTINYLVGYAGSEIPAKGSTTIETSIDFDISSTAHTITYEVVK